MRAELDGRGKARSVKSSKPPAGSSPPPTPGSRPPQGTGPYPEGGRQTGGDKRVSTAGLGGPLAVPGARGGGQAPTAATSGRQVGTRVSPAPSSPALSGNQTDRPLGFTPKGLGFCIFSSREEAAKAWRVSGRHGASRGPALGRYLNPSSQTVHLSGSPTHFLQLGWHLRQFLWPGEKMRKREE